MTVRLAERRRSVRSTAAYATLLVDPRGRVLARGRAANISEHGLFIIVSTSDPPEEGKVALVEITIPSSVAGGTRIVVYSCRIVRRQELGQLVGLGVEFREKLA
jgi:hypothetical protein